MRTLTGFRLRASGLLVALLLLTPALAVAAAQAGASPDAQDARTAAAKPQINLNTASLEQLETLPGVGRRTAERIIEYRKKTPFTKIEQLMNVKGIGEKSVLRIKPLVVATPAPADKASQQR